MSNCHFPDLPDEVLIFIAIKLPLQDLLSLTYSCRRFSVLIAQSSLMQYLIRTMRNGLHDPLVSDISIPQRFKALETWERAWLDLTVGEPCQRHILSAIGLDDSRRCRVQSGILIETRFNDIHLSKAYSYLDFLHLLNRSEAVARINFPDIGGDAQVRSWTYSPKSDLMAIAFQPDRRRGPPKLQFHQFSTGDKHPSAANHSLELNHISIARGTCIDCCGDNIVVVILNGERVGGEKGDFIFLVEWKIGRITQVRKAQPRTYDPLVTFLSHDVVLFAQRDTFALQVCKLTRAGLDAAPILETLSSLGLPGLLGDRQLVDIRLTQPSSLSEHHPSSLQRSLSAFPFRSDPEDDILAFDVYFRAHHERRIIFVAHRRTLLSLASLGGSLIRPWENWGPRMTHWMELDPQNDSISLSGSRCVLVRYSHLRGHFVLDLRDFNPHRIRARSARSVRNKTAIASQAILSAGACFEEDIMSELPFVSIRKETVGNRVLLDDEWMAEILWDQDAQAEVIEFRTIPSPA